MTDLDWADWLAGSDCWTAEEKRYFNKGIAAYRKDFIMVQKLVGFIRKWSLLVFFLFKSDGLKIFFLINGPVIQGCQIHSRAQM